MTKYFIAVTAYGHNIIMYRKKEKGKLQVTETGNRWTTSFFRTFESAKQAWKDEGLLLDSWVEP